MDRTRSARAMPTKRTQSNEWLSPGHSPLDSGNGTLDFRSDSGDTSKANKFSICPEIFCGHLNREKHLNHMCMKGRTLPGPAPCSREILRRLSDLLLVRLYLIGSGGRGAGSGSPAAFTQ